MKKNTAKKRGWVPYVFTGLALSFVLSRLFPPDEAAAEAPPAPTTISGNSGGAVTLIPYEVRTRVDNRFLSKLNLTIEVPLVDGRLPSKSEMNAIAEHLVGTPRHARTWVAFLLPGMPDGAGAYATAHYLPCGDAIDCPEGSPPKPEGVKILGYMLYNTEYELLHPVSRKMRHNADNPDPNPKPFVIDLDILNKKKTVEDPESMKLRRAGPAMASNTDAQDLEMKFVRDTWICPAPGPIETGKVFPLSKTLCNKVSAGTVWIAMDSRPDYNAPEAVSPGVISVTQRWGEKSGPWFMPSGSLSLSPL